MSNPLLETETLPAFRSIRPEHVEPAVDRVLAENRAAIAELLNELPETPSWDQFVVPLERLENRLDAVWSPVRHLNSVMNSDALRAAYNACLPKLSAYASELSQNTELYTAFDRLAQSPGFEREPGDRRKLVRDALRDFHLSGVDLPEDRKERLREIDARLSTLTSRFEENVLDATQSWTLQLQDATRLGGVPESSRAMLAQNARERDLDGYVITLDFPSYYAILTYADDRNLREQVYTAYATRASDQGPDAGRYDNSELMLEILRLREEKAQLTGFTHHAERSLATKMADRPETVEHFLRDLAVRARPYAEADLADMREYASTRLDLTDLQSWDYGYVAEKIRADRLGLSQEMLKPYFPADRVVTGLFGLVERLFGVSITEDDRVETWHDDVRYFVIRDREGEERAGFYLDLYARSAKRGGAWMDVCRSRFVHGNQRQLPVAFMTCNSTPPVDGKPALFTHDEVITLFHEFGHGLHHMLTRVDHPEIGGINGVEWDAVELPSQFMENWCWEREALDLFARHHETGKAMPQDLFERMVGTRHFQSALQLLRQVEFALFDMRLHSDPAPASIDEIQQLLDQVRDEVAVIRPPSFNRFQHGFSHIFAGGYAAGYYSYKWAEVLSADAFARFEEEGLFSPEVGHAYLQEILEVGASRPALESFKAFRGREPNIDALLRHSGLEAA
ncbi:M3 family metallopeptidase [Thioalkalivibrio paradoxus]|uniref:oligopeptidase A n=1 Tax=Thioalkalivibrio paradoxus ARh 1 TaxID=713585 RepID=W0DEZ1_9GAMM|nr:M3 family metallopeptidase [Thioalkalivibrio paradoxus]AHE96926.1 oligopeptidase A [Thioalkalivibrio paradoxus ARh 1]